MCVIATEPFGAVGVCYEEFAQISHEELRDIREKSSREFVDRNAEGLLPCG